MATRNVVLTDAQSALVDQLVESGRVQNASEALRAGLRVWLPAGLLDRAQCRQRQVFQICNFPWHKNVQSGGCLYLQSARVQLPFL